MPMTLLPAIHGCRARIARSGTASQAHIIRGSLMTGLALFVFGSLPVAAGMSKLNALEVARRGREFMSKKGDKSLGRGLVSLALHLDPFVYQEQEFVGWLPALLQSEPLNYWRGSTYIGHDKTYLESLFPREHLFRDKNINFLKLIAWRNLQLTGLSCCGIDNLAVFFQQANKHMYLAPFVDLVPGAADGLKKENQNMYKSFKQWWVETGRRPMPEPPMEYKGHGRYEWQAMKVSMKPSRVPVGWLDFIEAAIALRLEDYEAARSCLRMALRKNPELQNVAKEFLPEIVDIISGGVVVVSPPVVDESKKYIVCYNPHVGLGNLAVVMVSAHMLAKLTGRTLLLHWNVNSVSRHAFKLKELPGVRLLPDYSDKSEVVFSGPVKHLYLFHMMNSENLGEVLETLGCSDLQQSLSRYQVVTVSSNLFFAPLLKVNPHVPEDAIPGFPEMLHEMFAPGQQPVKRALEFLRETGWGKLDWWGSNIPVIAIHVRAREDGEDNDDWPTASSPNRIMLDKLRHCLEHAIARELKVKTFDIFVASTTESARSAVVETLDDLPGLRNVLTMKSLDRNRKADTGAVDAMAEALLISRADVFLRLVIGTSGFSTFAYLSNALRLQNDWVNDLPWLKRRGFAPNYVVTEGCGPNRCYLAPPDVRMANIGWHGKQYTQRSCGDPVEKVERKGSSALGCRGLRPVTGKSGPAGDEL